MKWNQIDPYYLESDCGRYRICKAYVHGVPVYTAWELTGRVGKDGNWLGKRAINVFDSAEEAKRVIQQQEKSDAESIQE